MGKQIINWILLVIGAYTYSLGTDTSLMPDEPINDFNLPTFSSEGFKVREIIGQKGYYLEEDRLKVIDITLNNFSGDVQETIINTVHSSEAIIELKKQKAFGAGYIFFNGNGYQVEGLRWKWDGAFKQISIEQNAHVIFENKSLAD